MFSCQHPEPRRLNPDYKKRGGLHPQNGEINDNWYPPIINCGSIDHGLTLKRSPAKRVFFHVNSVDLCFFSTYLWVIKLYMSSVEKPLLVDDCIGLYVPISWANFLSNQSKGTRFRVWKIPHGEEKTRRRTRKRRHSCDPVGPLGNLQGIDGCKAWINHGHALELWKYSGTFWSKHVQAKALF